MKILYCGWGGSSLTWASAYGESIVYYLRKLGHKVMPIYYRRYIKENPDKKLDDKLIAETEFIKPDIVLLLKCENLNPATIKLLRGRGYKIAYYSCDDPQLFLRHAGCRTMGLSSNYAFSWCMDTVEMYRKNGIPSEMIHAGFDDRIWDISVPVEDDEREKYTADVIFPGATYRGAAINRIVMVRTVANAGIYFKLFGPKDWEKEKDLLPYYGGYLDIARQEGTKAILCSKMVLNTTYMGGRRTPSIRMYEVIGLGRVCVSYKNPELDLVVPEGKGVVYWTTFGEMIEKIQILLGDDKRREAIAKAGREYILKNYTTEIQIKKMCDCLEKWISQ